MNYDLIATKVGRADKQDEILRQFKQAGDAVTITDALLNIKRGGSDILVFLAKEGVQRMFYIRVLCDRWGNPVKDKDTVEWTVDKGNKDEFDQKRNARQMREMSRRGHGERFIDRFSAEVKHGCIYVDRKAAVQLLNLHGVAYKSGDPLSRLRERGSAKKIMPNGKTGQVHNWRFMEVPASEYAELEATAKKKSGRKKKAAKVEVDFTPGPLTTE